MTFTIALHNLNFEIKTPKKASKKIKKDPFSGNVLQIPNPSPQSPRKPSNSSLSLSAKSFSLQTSLSSHLISLCIVFFWTLIAAVSLLWSSIFRFSQFSYSRWLTGNMTYLMISSLTKPPLTTPPSKVFYISFFPSIIYNFPLCIRRWLEALPDLNNWCCHLLIQRCFLPQRFNCQLLQLLFHNGGRFLSSLNLMESYCRFLIDFKSLCLCVCAL